MAARAPARASSAQLEFERKASSGLLCLDLTTDSPSSSQSDSSVHPRPPSRSASTDKPLPAAANSSPVLARRSSSLSTPGLGLLPKHAAAPVLAPAPSVLQRTLTPPGGGPPRCPVCSKELGWAVSEAGLNAHLDECLTEQMLRQEESVAADAVPSPASSSLPPALALSMRPTHLDDPPALPVAPPRPGVRTKQRVSRAGPRGKRGRYQAPEAPPPLAHSHTHAPALPATPSHMTSYSPPPTSPPAADSGGEGAEPDFAVDTLQSDLVGNECIICFEELRRGQTVVRLACICLFHKACLDLWWRKSRSCPLHTPS